jgi:ABC-type sugar transport system ATPase subunit
VVQQVDTAWAVYNHPANRFVASFVGSNNFTELQQDASGQARVWGQPVDIAFTVRDAAVKGAVASARPEVVNINPQWTEPGIRLGATVRQCMFTGRELQVTVEVEGHGLIDALTPPSQAMVDLRPGNPIDIGIRTRDLLFFAPGETGQRLQ